MNDFLNFLVFFMCVLASTSALSMSIPFRNQECCFLSFNTTTLGSIFRSTQYFSPVLAELATRVLLWSKPERPIVVIVRAYASVSCSRTDQHLVIFWRRFWCSCYHRDWRQHYTSKYVSITLCLSELYFQYLYCQYIRDAGSWLSVKDHELRFVNVLLNQ